jgi:hypothetical protein
MKNFGKHSKKDGVQKHQTNKKQSNVGHRRGSPHCEIKTV